MQFTDSELLDLKLEHTCLEEELRQERARPVPDALRVSVICKRKLAIKDRMAELREHHPGQGAA